jgi:type I restriction enzyme S subunit
VTPEDFVATFEVIAEAQGGIKKLRGMILDLAMRGNLVARDASDEPASRLIARLRAAPVKGRVQQVPTTAIVPPYEIDESWQWCHFTDVVSIESCLVDPADYLTLPHVAPDNIEKGTGRLLPYNTIGQDGVTSSKHRFYAGQILYSKIRPNLSKVVIVDFEGLCSADMYPLAAKVDTRFLYLFMLSPEFLKQVVREDNRLAMPKVNQQQLSETVVAVPPIQEQKRIVAKVDQLMALCDDLEARQAKKRETAVRLNRAVLDALTSAEGPEEVAASFRRIVENFDVLTDTSENVAELRSVVLTLAAQGRLSRREPGDTSAPDLRLLLRNEREKGIAAGIFKSRVESPLGAPLAIPDGWVVAPMASLLAESLMNGRSVPDRHDGFPVLRLSAIRGKVVDYTESKPGAWTADEAAAFVVKSGDFLIVRGNGAIRLVGRGCIAGTPPWLVAFPDTMIRARLNPLIVCVDWLRHIWGSTVVRQQIENFARTSAGIFKVNQDHIHEVMLPLPPLAEQARIVAKVDQLMALCDTLEAALRRAEATAQKLAEAVVAEIVA